jgi:hypothetical protein
VPNFALENEGTALSGAEILQAMWRICFVLWISCLIKPSSSIWENELQGGFKFFCAPPKNFFCNSMLDELQI